MHRLSTRRHEAAPVCNGAHQRTCKAMNLCSGPQRAASERRRRTQKTQKNSIGAASAAYTGPLRAESSSASPVVLAVVVVIDAMNLPDSNHRSEAVLEHSRRSGAQVLDVAMM